MQHIKLQYEQTILRSKLEILEEAFKIISREIHDNIGQILSLAKLNLNTLPAQNMHEHIEDIDRLISKAIVDLRAVGKHISSKNFSEFGFSEAVQLELLILEKISGIACYIDQSSFVTYSLSKQQSTIIFRLVQLLLHELVKQNKTTYLHVKLYWIEEKSVIIIKHNDVNFKLHHQKSILRRSKLVNAFLSTENGYVAGEHMIKLTLINNPNDSNSPCR